VEEFAVLMSARAAAEAHVMFARDAKKEVFVLPSTMKPDAMNLAIRSHHLAQIVHTLASNKHLFKVSR
jgi:hypothetical protein